MSGGTAGGAGEGGGQGPRVLIAIAGRQHADQLAAALAEAGADATLFHTRPVRAELRGRLAGRNRWRPLRAVAERVAAKILPDGLAKRFAYRMYMGFDRAVAPLVGRVRPDAVLGYENGARAIFEQAKRLGIPTILDAASVHHALQAEAGLVDAGTPFRAFVDARKDAEIALADHILTCSTLARDSYVAAGVPAARVHTVPLGFEPGMFGPGPDEARTGPLRLAFVGRYTRVKGADVLADALDTVAARGLAFELRMAADPGVSNDGARERLDAHGCSLGKLPHEELPGLYRWADALVLPSRFDSFGLVVLEALACGLPVIVSDRVGAKDFVEHGINGLILPSGDAGALADALAEHARDPGPLRAMRPAALASAKGAEWQHYRRRAAETVGHILGWRARGSSTSSPAICPRCATAGRSIRCTGWRRRRRRWGMTSQCSPPTPTGRAYRMCRWARPPTSTASR
jgi:glycosyltransferase involved in cell wall biosynthesis